MIARLNAFSLRLRQSVLRVWSVLAVGAMTLLLLAPEATGEFVNGIPSLFRYLLVGLIFAFLVVFYPQFRVWQYVNRQGGASMPARQTRKSETSEAAPEASRTVSDPVQEALLARKRRAGLIEEEAVPEVQTESTPLDPSVKLADWAQDKEDTEDDFYAMLSTMAKDAPSNSADESQSEGSIVDDVMKNRQANSNDQKR